MKMQSIFVYWLPLAVLSTVLCFLIYATVQQNYRQSANDPQIGMAEDVAALLGNNERVELGTRLIDIEKSLSPFMIVYGKDGKVLSTNAVLDGTNPVVPPGVLEYAKTHPRNILTWQPKPNVRIAAVAMKYEGNNPGIVLAGRSLREVEKRENKLSLTVGVTWLFSLFAMFIAVALAQSFKRK